MEQFMNMLVLALLAGSPANANQAGSRIENWPTLKVSEHVVAVMPAACTANASGCAVINFGERTCEVYVAWREPQKASVRERELKRCRGYDEAPYRLKAAYAQWLAAGAPCKPSKDAEGQSMIAAMFD